MSSLKDKRLGREMVALTAILIALIGLSVRPFGFRYFIHGLASNQLFSLSIVVGIVVVCVVMLQRMGIIFPDASTRRPPHSSSAT